MKEIIKLKPFTKFCCTIGNIPTSYMISLSYEEQLLWLCDYIKNTIIPAVNGNSEAITELQTLFTQLKNYVDNYFVNLDLTQEIEKVLDEMVESGKLGEILEKYLNLGGDTTFNTTTDLISTDKTLTDNQIVRTLGYYNINDGGQCYFIIHTAKPTNKFIIELNNGLFAEMLISNELNIKACGGHGDGINNDDTIINNALQFMKNSNVKNLRIPTGNYLINDTITVFSGITIRGDNKFNTAFIQSNNVDMLSKPILQTDITEEVQNEHIFIQNLGFISTGERTVLPVNILNCHSFTMDNCNFSVTGTPNNYHGINIDRTGEQPSQNFLTTIKNCRFSQSRIRINATDSYITQNELWGNGIVSAVTIINASNSVISNNQIVGGSTYGGIYIDTNNEGLKITNNYFDGSYNTINTQYGIYAEGYLTHCLISNNNFWKQKNGGLFLKQISASTISNNIFEDCDYYLNGSPDIFIGQQSFANIITNNSFFRTNYYNQETSQTTQRPTANPSPAIEVTNLANYQPTQIYNNTTLYDQFYGMIQYAGAVIARDNVSSKLYVPYDINTDEIKNYEQIVLKNPSDVTKRQLQVISNPTFRIDNVKTILITELSVKDMDAIYNQDMSIFLNSTSNVQNLPTFFAKDQNHYIYYKHIVSGYAIQFYCAMASPSAGVIGFRFLLNNTWQPWRHTGNLQNT